MAKVIPVDPQDTINVVSTTQKLDQNEILKQYFQQKITPNTRIG
jgi:hypothetical protein